jgi:SAM-dependent methyltransferase
MAQNASRELTCSKALKAMMSPASSAGNAHDSRSALTASTQLDSPAGMREQFSRALPNLSPLAGSAERIPLTDNAVDAVLVAQAWHWVDVERAVPEVARVLSRGGRLGLIWNIRDEREDWVAQLGQIMHQGIEQDMRSTSPRIGPPFGPVERLDVEWTYHLKPTDVLDLVASRSYVITLPATERQALDAKVRHLLDTHPALSGEQDIQMPYIARCSRATLT